MRILFLSQLVPYPLDAGPKVRSYYVLRHLAEAGHAVTLLAFSRETDTRANMDHLRSFCSSVHAIPLTRSRVRDARHLIRSLISGAPFLIAQAPVVGLYAKVQEIATTEENTTRSMPTNSGGRLTLWRRERRSAQQGPGSCSISITPFTLSLNDWLRMARTRSGG